MEFMGSLVHARQSDEDTVLLLPARRETSDVTKLHSELQSDHTLEGDQILPKLSEW